jgi:hypothetical protein
VAARSFIVFSHLACDPLQVALRTNDGVTTAAAIVIFWPAAFFVGGDKQTAAELSQMKGQILFEPSISP